jgi:hypothetical protein
MWLQNLSQTRELAVACANPALDACNEPIGSDGAMIWGRHCPIHGERAKPLVGRRRLLMLIVVCCVCVCGCVWLCFVCWSDFSYHTGRKSTSAKAKWPIFAHSYHKIGPQTPQISNIMTGCANSSSFRDVAHVLTYCLQGCFGRDMSAQKSRSNSLKCLKKICNFYVETWPRQETYTSCINIYTFYNQFVFPQFGHLPVCSSQGC